MFHLNEKKIWNLLKANVNYQVPNVPCFQTSLVFKYTLKRDILDLFIISLFLSFLWQPEMLLSES